MGRAAHRSSTHPHFLPSRHSHNQETGAPMQALLPFIISGIAVGSIYGVAATGLVLTYKTSGIFNFAQGALAATGAYFFYWLHIDHDMHWLPAALLTVFVLGPLLGLACERLA